MEMNVVKEVAALQRMTVTQLREKYADTFGEVTATGNRTWLVRRIAWRLQALAEGDLSERAKARAAELVRRAGAPAGPGGVRVDRGGPVPAVRRVPRPGDPGGGRRG